MAATPRSLVSGGLVLMDVPLRNACMVLHPGQVQDRKKKAFIETFIANQHHRKAGVVVGNHYEKVQPENTLSLVQRCYIIKDMTP